jgi:predicted MFS family arabinose efflux permease
MLLWSGQFASTLGTTSSNVVVPLLILALTGSPEAAGIASALRTAPYLVFSLPVGALIDRWDRKAVMIRTDIGRAVAVATIPVAMFFDVLTLWQIYVVALVEGSLFVFFNIAEVAALPRVVPVTRLAESAAQNEAGFALANIAGPPLGTVLYQALGRAFPFIANFATYVLSIVTLLYIKTPFRAEPRAEKRHLGAEVMEGLRWMWANPLIRFMAILTGGMNLINAASPLVVIVLAKQMGAPDASIGAIFSAAGVGGIAGSLVGGQIQKRFTFGQVIIAVAWLEAVLVALYAVAPSYYLIAAILGVTSFLGPIYNVVQFSYRLSIIPDGLQGRVNSVFRLLAFGFMPMGAALSGVLIERFDATVAIMVLTVWMAALAIATSANRHVRNAKPVRSSAG